MAAPRNLRVYVVQELSVCQPCRAICWVRIEPRNCCCLLVTTVLSCPLQIFGLVLVLSGQLFELPACTMGTDEDPFNRISASLRCREAAVRGWAMPKEYCCSTIGVEVL